jgi:hypothetical protein
LAGDTVGTVDAQVYGPLTCAEPPIPQSRTRQQEPRRRATRLRPRLTGARVPRLPLCSKRDGLVAHAAGGPVCQEARQAG